ncbi:MAG: hypothetical protein CAF45_006355 [Nitrospira sp. CG24E]|nr:MAG: hypothetical protein CAF45_006355 [Nitrospira sp. CG24E]
MLADGGKQPQRAILQLAAVNSRPSVSYILDSPGRSVYQDSMAAGTRRAGRRATATVMFSLLSAWSILVAAELPVTKNSSISDFQNRSEDVTPYNFDAPPQGLFRTITMAEGFDEELGFQRTHQIVPVKPTDRFRPDTPAVFIVFQLHQHYQGFQVFGRCYPEAVAGLDPAAIVGQDAMLIALEDDSGYLTLSPPQNVWKPGRYKVEIHVGEQVNEMTMMGTMRFTIAEPGT